MDCAQDPCANAATFNMASSAILQSYSISDVSFMSTFLSKVFNAFVNYWNDNAGDTVPTMLRIRGEFQQGEIPPATDAIGVFFDNNIKLEFIKDFDYSVSI